MYHSNWIEKSRKLIAIWEYAFHSWFIVSGKHTHLILDNKIFTLSKKIKKIGSLIKSLLLFLSKNLKKCAKYGSATRIEREQKFIRGNLAVKETFCKWKSCSKRKVCKWKYYNKNSHYFQQHS